MNAAQAWQSVLGQLQLEMPRASFDTWVRDSRPVSYQDGILTVAVRNAYARDWLENRLLSSIARLLAGVLESEVQVRFVVDGEYDDDAVNAPTQAKEDYPENQTSAQARNTTLNPRYTFENFVVGANTRLAHAAALAVAEKPARAYNPLFLYGGVGLGKTHLLHAIGNACHARGLSVLYVSSEEFTNDLINAIRTHTTQAFREKYRSIDVLLIDDIQFIAGKESTQEEFFHTFNTLHSQDKQIIVSSDRPPKSLVTLEERLRSRFEWGLIADIQPPDFETRLAILRYKAERAGHEVPNDVMEMIARRVQSNIRELEGALNRIIAYAHLMGTPVNLRLAEMALADLLPQRHHVAPEKIIELVARNYQVSVEEMLGRDRSQKIALPRQIAMYLLREMANASLPQIGEFLGGRDHTTVMYAIEKIARETSDSGSKLGREVNKLREQVYNYSNAAI